MSEALSFEKPGFGRSLWLAGLGLAAAVEEGGRSLFGLLEKAGERTGDTVRGLGKLVQDTVEHETRSALKRLGLLTRDDVALLAARLETLSTKIDHLSARQEASPLVITGISVTEPASAPARKAGRPRQLKA